MAWYSNETSGYIHVTFRKFEVFAAWCVRLDVILFFLIFLNSIPLYREKKAFYHAVVGFVMKPIVVNIGVPCSVPPKEYGLAVE
jgi:hypothetical protein